MKCIIHDPDHNAGNKDEHKFSNFITIGIDDTHECEGAIDIKIFSNTSPKNINRAINLLHRQLSNIVKSGRVSVEEMTLMDAENNIELRKLERRGKD